MSPIRVVRRATETTAANLQVLLWSILGSLAILAVAAGMKAEYGVAGAAVIAALWVTFGRQR